MWIVDVVLVGHAQNANAASVDRLLGLIESKRDAIDHVMRHARVHFPGQFNETGRYVVLTGDPA